MIPKIKIILPLETYAVRHPVLRQGRPISDCAMEGDADTTTYHFGLYRKDLLSGVVSFMKHTHPDLTYIHPYQLRGMAVLKQYQGQGYGRMLIEFGEKHLKENELIDGIWCNARKVAKHFYENQGYAVFGDTFIIPKIGLHYQMCKPIL